MMIDVDDGPLDKVAQGLVLKQLDDILCVGIDGVPAEGNSELLAERHSELVCCVCVRMCAFYWFSDCPSILSSSSFVYI